jgi:hypothetical protein
MSASTTLAVKAVAIRAAPAARVLRNRVIADIL